jgi:hypothetical protein
MKNIITSVNIVVNAAPLYENLGINKKFKIKLIRRPKKLAAAKKIL